MTPVHSEDWSFDQEISAAPLQATLFCENDAFAGPSPSWLTRFRDRCQPFCVAAISTFCEAGAPQALGLQMDGQMWEVEIYLANDARMRRLNRDYRGKDFPTDVLTFCLLAESPDRAHWTRLPSAQLGSVFLGWQWAAAHAQEEAAHGGDVARYLCERLAHGLLHLFGRHHDTMDAYRDVVRLQELTLARAGLAPDRP